VFLDKDLLVCAGLVKKDPNAGGATVPDPRSPHNPFCFFNVTWLVVSPGTIPAPAPVAPTAKLPAARAPAPAPSSSALDLGV
jgi:hypothetical protein